MKYIVLSLLILSVLCNERFKDGQQLRSHHHHTLDMTNIQHQRLFDAGRPIQVHLIPHSHDDVGWLKTVDEYYFGQHNNIQWAGVQYIIDSYVFSLLNDPTKKFIQVEVAFFKKWWDEQNDHMREQVKGLVKNGQLEFINGGWCMNDEATTYYEDIIDQMTLGHKFIFDNFGVRPTIGWQIDPFGHQSSQASLFSQMGFNGWFFARIDYQDKEKRLNEQKMEMIMRPLQKSGEDHFIFSHVQYYHYSAPPSFDFNTRQTNEPIIDDEKSKDYNLQQRAEDFVYYFRNQSLHYRGNVLTHTLGEDFQWDASPIYFKNIDKLLNYINTRKDVYNMEILYSTPSKYLEALQQEKQSYPTKEDDFFPYADGDSAYWTGYFVSRVAIKGLTRYYGRYSQFIHKYFTSLLVNRNSRYVNTHQALIKEDLDRLDEAMGILQHHDAVAGTEKQHVNDDYIQTLFHTLNIVNSHLEQIISEIQAVETGENAVKHYEVCNWNTTAAVCTTTYQGLKNNKVVQITVLDGKAQQQGEVEKVRVKVPRVHLRIVDQHNKPVPGEILCLDKNDADNCDLFFFYHVGTSNRAKYFKLVPSHHSEATTAILESEFEEDLEHHHIHVQIADAPLFGITYEYYTSYQGSGQKSGAYIFRPADLNGTTNMTAFGKPLRRQHYNGRFVKAIQIVGTLTNTVIRHFDIGWMRHTYEIESFIDSIPIEDGVGKEVVIKVSTHVKNAGVFYTDSNGLELQKRWLNYRPTWNLTVMEPASGNYFPINGMIVLEDAESPLTAALLNDRSQGGTSLEEGQFEVMVHRRTLRDDSRGVGEPLNETEFGKGLTQAVMHYLTYYDRKADPNQARKVQLYIDQPPYVFLSTSEHKMFQQEVQYQSTESFVDELLTQHKGNSLIKLYAQPWNNNTILFRAHNMQEVGSVEIQFPKNAVVTETTLTGTQSWANWLETRMTWNLDNETLNLQSCERKSNHVKPLQIRTFLVEFKHHKEVEA